MDQAEPGKISIATEGSRNFTGILAGLNQEMDKILKDRAMQARLLELGVVTEGAGTVEQTSKFLKDQCDVWKQVVSDIGLEPQ